LPIISWPLPMKIWKKRVEGFEPDVINLFLKYSWPGNLREMKNVIKRSVLLTKSKRISLDLLPPEMEMSLHQKEEFAAYKKEDEEQAIRKALERANYNKSKAAKLLDIDRKTLYNKLKLYNIDL
jgi:two-component system response regulator HydG